MAQPEEIGQAQEPHEAEVKDLGWQEPVSKIANPLVGGLPNEELWVLIRRFDKQMYHVKEFPRAPPGNLDLHIADEEEFSPDKLRANLERLYMTVGIGLLAFVKHIVRLRSWREKRRTSAFAAAYVVAWFFDLLAPLFFAVIIALIAVPRSRKLLFPPAPIALVSAKTGGLQKPKAGVLGSTDSATGAPENYKGEAVEAEAAHFVNSIASVAMSSVSGKHPQDPASEEEAGGKNDRVPDPTALAVSASKARAKSQGDTATHADKAKVPMQTAMWNSMRPVMHGLADVADTWERFGNALSPTPPFPRDLFRLRLASLLVPALAISFFVTNYMLVKGITFGIGFGFFGDPVITRGLVWLNSTFPHWQKLLELRNTILKSVPTNAQLTITLLRIGEANKAPLPPPPSWRTPPPDAPTALSADELAAVGGDIPLDATEQELRAAIEKDHMTAEATTGSDIDSAKSSAHKAGSKVGKFFKAGIKGTVNTILGADGLKAKAGSEPSKQRLGVVLNPNEDNLSGPIDFKCRYHGKRGHAYISTVATIPCVSFSLDKEIADGTILKPSEELHPVWSVAVADIKELKKMGGLGWKSKLIVGWALDREVADGLEIIDRQGNHWTVTAMALRDELFNRLIAMGGQKWESW